jgi:hypothetical protein
MNYLISFITFAIVLFFYIHINHQYKTSNDLEIYNIENPSRDRLEEVCNLKQPFVFKFYNEDLMDIFSFNYLIKKFGQFDINIRKIDDYDEDTELYLPFSIKRSEKLFNKKSSYITENNGDFISETGLIRYLNRNDENLKPPLCSNCFYDFIYGSNETCTPLRYSINYRNYILVTNGTADIKLVCPEDKKYLNHEKDYDNFEFRSKIDLWKCGDETKLRILDVTLNRGDIFYIPSYWWYTIKFNNNTNICTFQYRTYMNNIAILPELTLHFFQKQNTKLISIKTVKKEKIYDEKNETPEEIILDDKEKEKKIEEEQSESSDENQEENINDIVNEEVDNVLKELGKETKSLKEIEAVD